MQPKKWSFPLRISSVNVTKSAVLVSFTEETLNGKLHFLCSAIHPCVLWRTLNFIIWRASTRNSNQTFWAGGLAYRHTFRRQFGPPSSVLLFIVLSILMGFANGNINNNNNKNCCHENKNVTGQLKLLSHILRTL